MTHTGLREEEKSRGSAGDGFYVTFIVAAIVAHQQVVEDAHNAHQEQKEQDAFSKHVAFGAAKKFEKNKTKHKLDDASETHTEHAEVCLCLFTFDRFVPCIQQSTSA